MQLNDILTFGRASRNPSLEGNAVSEQDIFISPVRCLRVCAYSSLCACVCLCVYSHIGLYCAFQGVTVTPLTASPAFNLPQD